MSTFLIRKKSKLKKESFLKRKDDPGISYTYLKDLDRLLYHNVHCISVLSGIS